MKKNFLLSVLIPVYNERASLEALLCRVEAVPVRKEILLVDDGSTDGTREWIRANVEGQSADIRVFTHPTNQGKGAAIRTALAQATGDILLIQDADLEYDPADYPALLQPILDGVADVVYGNRFAGTANAPSPLPGHRLGNAVLTWLSNRLTGLHLTDMEVCYKVFTAEAIQGMILQSSRFEFEAEITARLAKRRCRFAEVPITYHPRSYAEGKKIGWRDGLQTLRAILKYRFLD